MFDEELAALPGPGLLLAGGDNVGASPPNSALLEDMPAIDVENAWGLDATSYGNHEFDYGVERLLKHQARANFPFLATNIVETATGQRAAVGDAVDGLHGQRRQGRRHRRRAEEHAGARLRRRDGRPRRSSTRRRGSRPSRSGCASTASGSRSSSSTRARTRARTRSATPPARPGTGPILGIADAPGHDRRRDDRRPHPPHLEPDARATSSSPRASTPGRATPSSS